MRHGLKGFVTWYLDTVTSHHGLHEHFMVCYPNIKATTAFFSVTCGLQIVGLISFPSSLTRFVIYGMLLSFSAAVIEYLVKDN